MIAIFPKIAEVAKTGNIEALSCVVREYLGGAATYKPMFDPMMIFENLGIAVEHGTLSSLAAIAGCDEGGRFVISAQLDSVSVKKMTDCEQRFLLGHLLGHYFLHMQPKIVLGDFIKGGYKELVSPLQRYIGEVSAVLDPLDKEADQFAVSLLLPKAMTRKAMGQLSLANGAKFFGVSKELLSSRFDSLSQPAASVVAKTSLSRKKHTMIENEGFSGRVEKKPKEDAVELQLSVQGSNGLQENTVVEEGSVQGSDRVSRPNSKILAGMDRIREIARLLDKSP